MKQKRRALFLAASVRKLAPTASVSKELLRRGEVREILGINSDAVTVLIDGGILQLVQERKK